MNPDNSTTMYCTAKVRRAFLKYTDTHREHPETRYLLAVSYSPELFYFLSFLLKNLQCLIESDYMLCASLRALTCYTSPDVIIRVYR